MQDSRSCAPARRFRRLVLGAAFATGLVVALAPHLATVRAADLPAASILAQADATAGSAADGRRAEAGSGAATKATPAPEAAPAPNAKASNDETLDAEDANDADDDASNGHVTADDHGIVIEKGDKRIRIGGLGRDREYDSFQQFVQDAPWLAGLVFLFVLFVFLIPLLIIVLLILVQDPQNADGEQRAMLKLAEHGVVPAGGGDGRRRVGHRGLGRCRRRGAAVAEQSRLRASAIPAPAHRVVGFAQGHHPWCSRARPHVLFDARQRHAEQHRSHPAVRRTRLLPAVVLRGPQQCAVSRHARHAAAGERVMPRERTAQRATGRHA